MSTDADTPRKPGSDVRAILAAIVASSNDAIVGKDLQGIVTSWNDAAERLFGFSAAEMIGQPITRIIPFERLAEEASILERLRRDERLTNFVTLRQTKSGMVIPVSLTISPIHDEAGTVIGVSKIARDLSEQQRLAQELRQREALLRTILETAPHGLIVIDRDGRVQSFSPAAQRMFGYTEAEVLGHNVNMLMPEPDREGHDGYMTRYLRTGEARIIGIGRMVDARRKDGSIFPIELGVGEAIVPGHHVFTGFVRDMTERLEQQRRLAELQAELVHVSRVSDLGQMLSALAHEVTQPLTAISNYVSGIRRLLTPDTPPLIGQAIDRIAEQGERARGIVQSLRSMVKKESRGLQPENLHTMIHEIGTLALAGSDRSVDLKVDVEPEAAHVHVDKVMIQQVLLNLMRNAVEAMDGSPVRRLEVAASRRGERVEVLVADSGPGLPLSVQSRLFQPFVTTKSEGLGIGLSICRAIVESHGGELAAESSDDAGTTFRFTIPAADAVPDEPQALQPH